MIKRLFLRINGIIGNMTANWRGVRVVYIAETYEWSIKHDALSITHALNANGLVRARVTYSPHLLRNQVVHFGSINTFLTRRGVARVHPSNRVIVTWFHIVPGDSRVAQLVAEQERVDRIHTSCLSTKETLVQAGIDLEKIVVIPLGVDLDVFTKRTPESRSAIRRDLGIASDRLVIGSFQKDGVGWGQGLEPKHEKGPDVFVRVVERLKAYDPLVLLSGPSRGYIMSELRARGIETVHSYPKDHASLARMYQALDLYLISSRVEGGPKALLEAWASGVPVVSTRVGMVPDSATDEQNVLMAASEDVDGLFRACDRLFQDQSLRDRLSTQGSFDAQTYSWNAIAKQYFDVLYRPFV